MVRFSMSAAEREHWRYLPRAEREQWEDQQMNALRKLRDEEERAKSPEQRLREVQEAFRDERRELRREANLNLVMGFGAGGFVMLVLAAALSQELPEFSFWLTGGVFYGGIALIWWLKELWAFVADWRMGNLKNKE